MTENMDCLDELTNSESIELIEIQEYDDSDSVVIGNTGNIVVVSGDNLTIDHQHHDGLVVDDGITEITDQNTKNSYYDHIMEISQSQPQQLSAQNNSESFIISSDCIPPIQSIKAIRTNEQCEQDTDFTIQSNQRILTTLESINAQQQQQQQHIDSDQQQQQEQYNAEISVIMTTDEPIEQIPSTNAITLYNNNNKIDDKLKKIHESELARQQLESLSALRKARTKLRNPKVPQQQQQNKKQKKTDENNDDDVVTFEVKTIEYDENENAGDDGLITIYENFDTNFIKEEHQELTNESYQLIHKNNETGIINKNSEQSGTIEIPKHLIDNELNSSSDSITLMSPIQLSNSINIINVSTLANTSTTNTTTTFKTIVNDNVYHQQTDSSTIKDEDLLAILEGNDSSDHHQLQSDNNLTSTSQNTDVGDDDPLYIPPQSLSTINSTIISTKSDNTIVHIISDDIVPTNELVKKQPIVVKQRSRKQQLITKVSPNLTLPSSSSSSSTTATTLINPSNTKRPKKQKKICNNELINSLVSEWSDDNDPLSSKSNDDDDVDDVANRNDLEQPEDHEKLKKIQKSSVTTKHINKSKITTTSMPTTPINTITETPSITNKQPQILNTMQSTRKRIIKKKIIWDPDAPETAISYASLVRHHKKTVDSDDDEVDDDDDDENNEDDANDDDNINRTLPKNTNLNKKRTITTTSPSSHIRKKVKTEVDKLLGDEGALNMLNALKNDQIPDGGSTNNNISPSSSPVTTTNVITNTTNSSNKSMPQRNRSKTTSSSSNSSTVINTNNNTSNATTTTTTNTTTTNQSTKKEPTKKRASKTNNNKSNSWDYVYSSRGGDDSMIIRRRSNSSYSSTASPRRLSIENTQPIASTSSTSSSTVQHHLTSSTKQKQSSSQKQKKSSNSSTTATSTNSDVKKTKPKEKFIFAKPVAKNVSQDHLKQSDNNDCKYETDDKLITNVINNKTITNTSSSGGKMINKLSNKDHTSGNSTINNNNSSIRRSTRGHNNTEESDNKIKSGNKSQKTINNNNNNNNSSNSISSINDAKANIDHPDNKKIKRKHIDETYHEISLQNHEDFVEIILTPKTNGKLKNFFTKTMLTEVTQCLNGLSSDGSVKAIVIKSILTNSFCNGIDISTLIQSSSEKRKAAAFELSTVLKNFIKSLATCKKPLIAGVHGSIVGIGVTILPLFDVVIASEKSTYELPYAKIGQIPEGWSILQLTNKINRTMKNELLFLSEQYKALDALNAGLITKIVTVDKLQNELLTCATKISKFSSQSLVGYKSMSLDEQMWKLDEALTDEQETLILHWSSSECQENFKQFLNILKW